MARLIYVMDPMCSWCWGFAPVLQGLAEQAAEHGVPLVLRVGGLRREQVAMDEAGRSRTRLARARARRHAGKRAAMPPHAARPRRAD